MRAGDETEDCVVGIEDVQCDAIGPARLQVPALHALLICALGERFNITGRGSIKATMS